MRRTRVIPCLTVIDGGLFKTRRFRSPRYVGDPINAVRIFNEKEVDELIVLDIRASRNRGELNETLVRDLAAEAFMPVAYGGGVSTGDQAERLIGIGIEKIVVDSAVITQPALVADIAGRLGSSSTVVSITVKRDWRGRPRVFDHARRRVLPIDPADHAHHMVELGAGEIMINDVDRDGTYEGIDTALVQSVAQRIDAPLIACGGAGTIADLAAAADAGASAVAAGSQFVFMGPHRAVLINYPDEAELRAVLP